MLYRLYHKEMDRYADELPNYALNRATFSKRAKLGYTSLVGAIRAANEMRSRGNTPLETWEIHHFDTTLVGKSTPLDAYPYAKYARASRRGLTKQFVYSMSYLGRRRNHDDPITFAFFGPIGEFVSLPAEQLVAEAVGRALHFVPHTHVRHFGSLGSSEQVERAALSVGAATSGYPLSAKNQMSSGNLLPISGSLEDTLERMLHGADFALYFRPEKPSHFDEFLEKRLRVLRPKYFIITPEGKLLDGKKLQYLEDAEDRAQKGRKK